MRECQQNDSLTNCYVYPPPLQAGDRYKTVYLGYTTSLMALGGMWGPCAFANQ